MTDLGTKKKVEKKNHFDYNLFIAITALNPGGDSQVPKNDST